MKKVLIFNLIGLTLLTGAFLFSKTTNAQTLEDYDRAVERGSLNAETLHQYTLSDTIFGSFRAVVGTQDENGEGEPGAIQHLGNMVASVYAVPPASGVYYAYDVLHNFGAVPAYAQTGVGFSGLQPILPVWKAMRNVAYILFTLIFIGLGLAIMFRIKISPQAVMTIETMLPKVVGTLLLITFSYAIAGFLIDLMYVFMSLGINILKSAGIDPALLKVGPFKALTTTPQRVIGAGFFGLIPMFFSMTSIGVGSSVVALIVGGLIGAVTGPQGMAIGAIAMGGGLILIRLIWAIIAIFCLFKLLFGLIKAYINIIIAIITAPLQIMIGAIPGIQAGFGQWLKKIGVELMIFPAVLFVSMIGVYLLQSSVLGNMWQPPLIGGINYDAFKSDPNFLIKIVGYLGDIAGVGSDDNSIMAAGLLKSIIGMGFLLILAKLPDIIREMAKTQSGYGAAIGEAFGPIKTSGKIAGTAGVTYGEERLRARTTPGSIWDKVLQHTGEAVRDRIRHS